MRPPLPHVELPFLILHGNQVWPLLLLALTVLTLVPLFVVTRRRWPIARRLVISAIAPALWLAVMFGLGRHYVEQFSYPYDARVIGPRDPIAIAAALPGARAEALQTFQHRASSRIASREQAAFALAAQRHLGKCFARELMEAWEFDAALDESIRCGWHGKTIEILYTQGRFYAAAAVQHLWGWDIPVLDVAVGDWKSLADHYADLASAPEYADRRERLRCFEALLRSWDGDPLAFVNSPTSSNDRVCNVLLAIARGPATDISTLERKDGSLVWLDLLTAVSRHKLPWESSLLIGGSLQSDIFFSPALVDAKNDEAAQISVDEGMTARRQAMRPSLPIPLLAAACSVSR